LANVRHSVDHQQWWISKMKNKKNPVEGGNLQTGTIANAICKCNLKSFFDYVIVPSSTEVAYVY
jgi:hypothetical protein